jgi:hypothetical protein
VEERNIPNTIKRKTTWIGLIQCRTYRLKHVIGEKIEGAGTRGRRRKAQLDNIKETKRYWNFKLRLNCGELALEEAMNL